jgi:caffeoyl-CoA O-methyltransferase
MSYIADKDFSTLVTYAESFTSDESHVLRELREHCNANFEDKAMLSGFVQGRLLSMFSHMIRPKVVLEVGTYLGYSALCLAEGLAEGGKVITLDILEETNRVARNVCRENRIRGPNRIPARLGHGPHSKSLGGI